MALATVGVKGLNSSRTTVGGLRVEWRRLLSVDETSRRRRRHFQMSLM